MYTPPPVSTRRSAQPAVLRCNEYRTAPLSAQPMVGANLEGGLSPPVEGAPVGTLLPANPNAIGAPSGAVGVPGQCLAGGTKPNAGGIKAKKGPT